MGKIELDHTGSGGGVTLSSDGTDLLLDGTAIGGGSPDLYADNYDGSSTLPSATGTNAIAIGANSSTSGNNGVAIGRYASCTGTAIALGYSANASAAAVSITGNGTSSASAGGAIAIGRVTASGIGSIGISQAGNTITAATASGNYSVAIGANSTPAASVSTGSASMALQGSYASGTDSFAAAIANNTSSYGATGNNSIAMGDEAKATTNYAVAIGAETQSRNWYGISIGYQNDNGTLDKALTLGWQNTTSGNRSVAIGDNNDCTTADAYALGTRAKSSVRGKYAYASGQFAAGGDAQGGQFILRADTTDATATVLTTNNSTAGSTNQIVAASDTCITFDGTITAMQNGAQAYASWRIEGLLVNDGGTTTLANSATTVISNSSSWGMALSADNTNNALAITCTGEAAHNIRWVANIRTSEVTYA